MVDLAGQRRYQQLKSWSVPTSWSLKVSFGDFQVSHGQLFQIWMSFDGIARNAVLLSSPLNNVA
jgi:hypothetical protein